MPVSLSVAFEILFSEEQLQQEFGRRHADAMSRGVDRRNGPSFARDAKSELAVASRKCLDGTYRFTPYLESLRIKDRWSAPRMISIPSIRDRVVLSQLNKLLRLAFPEETRSHLANEHIKRLTAELDGLDPAETWTCGMDIKKFYDSIDRNRLRKLFDAKLSPSLGGTLIWRAINTPTVPATYKARDAARFRGERGVPQGLAISNALAALYLRSVDVAMNGMPVIYHRFVDDILLVGSYKNTALASKSFVSRATRRGLSVYGPKSAKGHHSPLSEPFSYLGYVFKLPVITVREATIERLLQSLAAKLTDYKYNKKKVLERRTYLSEDMLREAFLDELNERITGAISGKRRYGWVAYFSQINDHQVLFSIDTAVRHMVERNDDLAPHLGKLKRFSRAFFEMKYRPNMGYVRDYDRFTTPAQMLEFLVFRGQVPYHAVLTPEQIREKFETYREAQLHAMLADEGAPY